MFKMFVMDRKNIRNPFATHMTILNKILSFFYVCIQQRKFAGQFFSTPRHAETMKRKGKNSINAATWQKQYRMEKPANESTNGERSKEEVKKQKKWVKAPQ